MLDDRPASRRQLERRISVTVIVATAGCCAYVLSAAGVSASPFAQSLIASGKPRRPVTISSTVAPKTPSAALVDWFDAVRAGNVAAVQALTSSRAQSSVGRRTLRAAVATVGSALGRPYIVQVTTRGGTAAVRLLVLGYGLDATRPVSEIPLTVVLVRNVKGWQVGDANYLVISARAIRAVRAG